MKALRMTVALWLGASAAVAQTADPMTQDQLSALTAPGVELRLGGPGMGYEGNLTLTPDGRGAGQATTDAGDVITLDGTWVVRDGQFCRTWLAPAEGAEVCEVWVPTSDRSADVFVDGEKAGANAW